MRKIEATEAFTTVRAIVAQMQANGSNRTEMARFVQTVYQTKLLQLEQLDEISAHFDLGLYF